VFGMECRLSGVSTGSLALSGGMGDVFLQNEVLYWFLIAASCRRVLLRVDVGSEPVDQ
jgi:hypothetical protein